MNKTIEVPTAARVAAAASSYDQQHQLPEQTLEELFGQYPDNSDLRHVLLKVVAVNSLHHTCIFALDTVARHIQANHAHIDRALQSGSPNAVEVIARVKVQGKVYNFLSFASRFANWHNHAAYPVYDSHVDHYLWELQQQNHFAAFLHPDLWNYPRFVGIMSAFRDAHKLGDHSFKQLDKFLHLEAPSTASATQDPEPCGPGAFDYYPGEELVS